jgi:predicted acetyltransferase
VTDRLSIDPATAAEQSVIANLLQLYIHDFSELFAGTPRCDLDADGLYRPDIPLGHWWQLPNHVPLLLRVDGRLAGFALINDHGHSGLAIDRNVAEFFIVRKYRRAGVGRAAALAIFSRFPGQWEAAVMRANTGARAFWAETIAAHPAVQGIAVEDCHDDRWNGTLFRFAIAP